MSGDTPSLQRPTTRAARLSAIEQALLTHVVTSQSQLSEILSNQGIEVTQATLSRDLDEMNAVKVRTANGSMAYAIEPVSKHAASSHPNMDTNRGKGEQQMTRVLSGLVTSVAAARNLVVVHTPSGAAQYVASVIDKQPMADILGTIAGDDTVMMICTDDDTARTSAEWLLSLASQGRDKA
ncbi:arginine repressor [Bifidobacterium sp. SMB2]|uniref:Arginine repressor n=1 Tax=Bifidobacterium saimiriisciurei TaxID=2661627 RepID=A0ABX0CBC9_9BIFI|nr:MULTISPECIES: arginine repressor [Bifidobacterium]NEG95713.1 arginine repressor [Bifidobacterium sp. SMB2]NEH11140.1 arginine repressor [Bifidobacterium saimiriisciurei]